MTAASVLVAVIALLGPSLTSQVEGSSLPAQAQVIDQRIFNVLNATQPPAEFNADNVGISFEYSS
jgi:gluconolactonase